VSFDFLANPNQDASFAGRETVGRFALQRERRFSAEVMIM
jgi:hypothetical protein